jgi:hypothetical protein
VRGYGIKILIQYRNTREISGMTGDGTLHIETYGMIIWSKTKDNEMKKLGSMLREVSLEITTRIMPLQQRLVGKLPREIHLLHRSCLLLPLIRSIRNGPTASRLACTPW